MTSVPTPSIPFASVTARKRMAKQEMERIHKSLLQNKMVLSSIPNTAAITNRTAGATPSNNAVSPDKLVMVTFDVFRRQPEQYLRQGQLMVMQLLLTVYPQYRLNEKGMLVHINGTSASTQASLMASSMMVTASLTDVWRSYVNGVLSNSVTALPTWARIRNTKITTGQLPLDLVTLFNDNNYYILNTEKLRASLIRTEHALKPLFSSINRCYSTTNNGYDMTKGTDNRYQIEAMLFTLYSSWWNHYFHLLFHWSPGWKLLSLMELSSTSSHPNSSQSVDWLLHVLDSPSLIRSQVLSNNLQPDGITNTATISSNDTINKQSKGVDKANQQNNLSHNNHNRNNNHAQVATNSSVVAATCNTIFRCPLCLETQHRGAEVVISRECGNNIRDKTLSLLICTSETQQTLKGFSCHIVACADCFFWLYQSPYSMETLLDPKLAKFVCSVCKSPFHEQDIMRLKYIPCKSVAPPTLQVPPISVVGTGNNRNNNNNNNNNNISSRDVTTTNNGKVNEKASQPSITPKDQGTNTTTRTTTMNAKSPQQAMKDYAAKATGSSSSAPKTSNSAKPSVLGTKPSFGKSSSTPSPSSKAASESSTTLATVAPLNSPTKPPTKPEAISYVDDSDEEDDLLALVNHEKKPAKKKTKTRPSSKDSGEKKSKKVKRTPKSDKPVSTVHNDSSDDSMDVWYE